MWFYNDWQFTREIWRGKRWCRIFDLTWKLKLITFYLCQDILLSVCDLFQIVSPFSIHWQKTSVIVEKFVNRKSHHISRARTSKTLWIFSCFITRNYFAFFLIFFRISVLNILTRQRCNRRRGKSFFTLIFIFFVLFTIQVIIFFTTKTRSFLFSSLECTFFILNVFIHIFSISLLFLHLIIFFSAVGSPFSLISDLCEISFWGLNF